MTEKYLPTVVHTTETIFHTHLPSRHCNVPYHLQSLSLIIKKYHVTILHSDLDQDN